MRFWSAIIIMHACAVCSVFSQDALVRSWRKAYPFVQLSDSAYEAARADTLLNKKQKPFKYSRVKLAADSIKAQVRCIPFDSSMYLGFEDMRMPIFVDKNFPKNRMMGIIEKANDHSYENWSYVEPADAHFAMLNQWQNMRTLSIQNFVRHNPSHYKYIRGAMELPPALDEEDLSTAKALEGKSLEVGVGALTYTKIGDDIKPQFKTDVWHKKGSSTIQMSQTALTDNWYKGGDNNMTLSTVQRLELTTYDENKKNSFDATLELRLSAYYTKTDTVHPLRVNDNLFSANIKYGYQAWKRWYYSTSLYVKTPIFDFHNANNKEVKSTFLAPLETNLSIGMEYKFVQKDKPIQFTLMLAPLAYNLKYVATRRVNETSYGIDEGDRALHKFGSTISSTMTWKFSSTASWTSRLYCFTSYDNIQAEFENTFNFMVSRRFSCMIYLYPRFDDSRDSKIQMKEMLTFGINYIW